MPSRSRSYSPVGISPSIKCDEKNKDYVSISGVISSDGKLYYEVREKEGFKKQGLVRFLKNCKKRMRKKMLLIWDNAPSHKSKEIKAYLSQQDKNNPPIWLENIPPYSPELNPIEQLWSCLKKRMTKSMLGNFILHQNQFSKETSRY